MSLDKARKQFVLATGLVSLLVGGAVAAGSSGQDTRSQQPGYDQSEQQPGGNTPSAGSAGGSESEQRPGMQERQPREPRQQPGQSQGQWGGQADEDDSQTRDRRSAPQTQMD